ncbi:Protein zwilch like protein [Turdus rufiventris]|nr:Protein zwilch like protein [Turdus rufiventris]
MAAERRRRAAGGLGELLLRIHEEGKDSIPEHPYIYETDVEISLVGGSCKSPVEKFWHGSSAMYILQKAIHNKESDSMEESRTDDGLYASEVLPKESPGALALSVGRAKQLISLYTMVQNPNMGMSELLVLPPLWARCDGCDPQHTCWIGAEPLKAANKVTGLNIYTVSCDGPTADKTRFANLEELKMEHKIRHHSSVVTTKGFAQYELIAAAAIEDTIAESGSSISVDITWNGVEKILETPPLISAATLNIALEPGDPRSPVFPLYQELQFLLALAEGLRMGVTEWPEPSESESALKLVQEFLTGVSSYQELIDCFTLVIKCLQHGEIQPWIHQGSSSFLSQLIQQSYHGKMEDVSFSDITPIQMLLEIGLEKMKKDYVSFFIGQELATVTYLGMLCVWSNGVLRICMKYYKENPLNEKHVFQLPITPALVKKFYQNDNPEVWKVEISSGHGQKEFKTTWQVSTSAPVEHGTANNSGSFSDSTVNGSEERLYFITMTQCSQVHFT